MISLISLTRAVNYGAVILFGGCLAMGYGGDRTTHMWVVLCMAVAVIPVLATHKPRPWDE